jgi:hypothetical protein
MPPDSGQPVPNEDLVNLPNWLPLKLRIDGDEPIRLGNVELLSYRHEYDFRRALVMRELRFRDRAGRVTSLRSRRFVSMHRMHQAAIAWDLTAENWSGRVELVSALDGRVVNQGVARYRLLEGRHLDPQGPRIYGSDVIALKARTRQSRIEVAEAARTRVYRGGEEIEVDRNTYQSEDYIQQVLGFEMREGAPVRVEKIVALYGSRDRGISEPLEAAARGVSRYPPFERALAGSTGAWDELWEVCDPQLPVKERVQFLLRFHTSHVLQVCSRPTAHHDAGVPARGLNGEAYRGHVFWDEVFLYPFLNFRPLPGRRAEACLRAPRLRVHSRHRPQDDRVLRPADLPRIDIELHRPCRGPRGHRSRELMGAVPRRAGERPRRHPGRDDSGGHPHGSDGGHPRHRSADLPRHGDPRRGGPLRAEAARTARRPDLADPVRGTPIKVTVEGSELTVVALADGFSVPIRVGVGDEVRELRRGDSCTFTIGAPAGVA